MIARLSDAPDKATAVAAIETIFFLSSERGRGLAGVERRRFFERWAGYYLNHAPDQVLLAHDRAGAIIGYLTGLADSAGAEDLFDALFYYRDLAPHFALYPAHFHVNLNPRDRGRGIGRKLVERFLGDCQAAKIAGAHVVTGLDAGNRGFYARLGFDAIESRGYSEGAIVLLGRRLDDNRVVDGERGD